MGVIAIPATLNDAAIASRCDPPGGVDTAFVSVDDIMTRVPCRHRQADVPSRALFAPSAAAVGPEAGFFAELDLTAPVAPVLSADKSLKSGRI